MPDRTSLQVRALFWGDLQWCFTCSLLKVWTIVQEITDSISPQDLSQAEHNRIVIQASCICAASSMLDDLSIAEHSGVCRLQEACGILTWDSSMRSLLLGISPMKWYVCELARYRTLGCCSRHLHACWPCSLGKTLKCHTRL